MQKKIISIIFVFVFLLTSGFGCKLTNKETQQAMRPVTLEYWRVFDGADAFDEIIAGYKALHPFVNINYRKLRYSEYEDELIDALAEDRGPDMFSIHSTWTHKYKNKIEPMPATITMAYPVVKGTVKKEIIPELRTTRSITLTNLKNAFIDTVFDDVVMPIRNERTGEYNNRVIGLPLSVDTMALFYNRDLFNNSGIADPPKYWNKEFQQNVKRLTKLDVRGKIIQSGVALGGAENIERSADVIALLMMQNGAVMSDGGSILFNRVPLVYKNQDYNPGLEALRFYSDFANSAKEVYAWNSELEDSVELFVAGNLAMMMGYSYHVPVIDARAPKLNYGIAPIPQIEGSGVGMNYANYWVETVSKKSEYTDEAWDFIQFAARAENVGSYLSKTKKPAALRVVAADQSEGEDVPIFAQQVLTARSWYRGEDYLAAESVIHQMINDAVGRQDDKEMVDIINAGALRVQQTIK